MVEIATKCQQKQRYHRRFAIFIHCWIFTDINPSDDEFGSLTSTNSTNFLNTFFTQIFHTQDFRFFLTSIH